MFPPSDVNVIYLFSLVLIIHVFMTTSYPWSLLVAINYIFISQMFYAFALFVRQYPRLKYICLIL